MRKHSSYKEKFDWEREGDNPEGWCCLDGETFCYGDKKDCPYYQENQ